MNAGVELLDIDTLEYAQPGAKSPARHQRNQARAETRAMTTKEIGGLSE
jgi:hypothetical protein